MYDAMRLCLPHVDFLLALPSSGRLLFLSIPSLHECAFRYNETPRPFSLCLHAPLPSFPSHLTFAQFEALMVRLLTEEASQHKRNSEDEILAAFQALDTDKKGYLEQVLLLFSGFVSPSTHLLVIVSFP